MPSSAPLPVVQETLQKARKLRDALYDEGNYDHDRIAAMAKSLLENAGIMNEKLHHVVALIYIDAIFQKSSKELENIPDLILKYDPPEGPLWHSYALYRMQKYDQSLQTLDSVSANNQDGEDIVAQHLRAQILFRKGNSAQSEEAYRAILQFNRNDAQIATNYVATQISNATPLVVKDSQSQDEEDNLLQTLLADIDSLPFDLLYNLATRQVLTGQGPDKVNLEFCLRQAPLQTNNEADVAPIKMNQAWARALQNGATVDSTTLPPLSHLNASGKLVALVNKALAMENHSQALRLLPTGEAAVKLNPLQSQLLAYNRAVLQYKSKQWDSCAETCRSLSNSSKKATVSIHSKLWWESRSIVLLSRAQLAKGDKASTKVMETLRELLMNLQKQSPSPLRDDALAYIQCHLADMEQPELQSNPNARLALLDALPVSWQSKPAVLASKASLYKELGQTEQAGQLLEVHKIPQVLAELWLADGEFAQAVVLYEQTDLTDSVAQARYARALTYADPAKAVEYWASVRSAHVSNEGSVDAVDGLELEKRPLPRLRTPRKSVTGVETPGTTNTATKKKSHEAVLRRRTRQRETYLAELDKRGLKHTQHPDPERWLPKYERSYNRRRRGKGGGIHRGAQGGISDKDAAHLDVAARQAARALGEPTSSSSTAHIAAVSSAVPGRKTGRRR